MTAAGQMKIGSLFTGIGGFDLGFEQAGWETLWQVEMEPFCNKVLKVRFPKAERYGDIQDCYGLYAEKKRKHYLGGVDLICAGVPCQDVSVAGKRAGLAGERTGLFFEFARILRELRPAWFVFENVPGLLSSNHGRDFAEVLRVLMVECGYGVCWRVLDSQFFGVAQRRRRVFIVGCFGKPCPAESAFRTCADAETKRKTALESVPKGHATPWTEPASMPLQDSILEQEQEQVPPDTVSSNVPPCAEAKAETGQRYLPASQEWEAAARMITTDRHTGLLSVRRLTPTECETLQGFPKAWTVPGIALLEMR